jgi:hypothetical protein
MTVGDRILLVLLLSASFIGFFCIQEVLSGTEDVTVQIDGKTSYRYQLDTDRLVRVEGERGSLNVEIKDRRVRVTGASCPNKLCEHQGWITSGAIICLPARISVIVGPPDRHKDGMVDAIAG